VEDKKDKEYLDMVRTVMKFLSESLKLKVLTTPSTM
jgi:hypothetical protein